MDEAIAFLMLGENISFAVALALMAMLGIVSALGLELNHELDADVGGIPILDWVLPGRLPMLAGLTLLLGIYGLVGLAGQQVLLTYTGSLLDVLPASLAAVLPAIILAKPLGAVMGRIMPKDETSAISVEQLVGKRGRIEYGTAREGFAARAIFRDWHGQDHYIMVEPDVPETTLASGEEVMLVSLENGAGRAIAVEPRPDLTI